MSKSKRYQKEKNYYDTQTFECLIPREFNKEQFVRALDALNEAFDALYGENLIDSKTQFSAALASMRDVPIPICDAAAICQTTRQWFRNLESQGRIKLIRAKDIGDISKKSGHGRKCFVHPTYITKILNGDI